MRSINDNEKMICSQYLFELKPRVKKVAQNVPFYKSEEEISFDEAFKAELWEYLCQYNSSVYIAELDGKIWGFVPTVFFSSSLVLALRFDIDPDVALRLIAECKDELTFVISKNIKTRVARMSERVRHHITDMHLLCSRIRNCFFETRLGDNGRDEIKTDFVRLIAEISSFVGATSSVDLSRIEGKEGLIEKLDIQLALTFALTSLIWARNIGKSREVKFYLTEMTEAACIFAEIDVLEDVAVGVKMTSWERISSERLMPFGAYEREGILRIGFQPYRRELSYLGIKQSLDINDFEKLGF